MNYIFKMLGNREESEEVLQTVFVNFYTNIAKIEKQESVNFWLIKTARNEVFKLFTERKRKLKLVEFDELIDETSPNNNDVLTKIEKNEIKKIIDKEIEKLPVEQKEVYVLKEYNLYNYKEIASILEIDVEIVKSRLFLARQKLIKRLSVSLKKM